MDKKNIILGILVLGVLMGAIDSTIVLLAIPTMTAELNATLFSTIWVILVYLLVMAVTTTQFGRLGDIYGRGRMFNAGFAIFTVGSLLCGFSSSALMLIAFRVVQAVGGALLQANSGAIVADTFEPNKRGRAFGYTSVGWSVGALLGIALGGAITTFIGWRYIFYINVPIGIVATYLGIKYIRDNPSVNAKVDWAGVAALTISLGVLSYAVINFAATGASVIDTFFIAIGIAILALFFYLELKSENPLMNLHLFRNNRVLTYSILAGFFMGLGFLAVVFIVILYLQGMRGLSPLDASALLVPGYLVSSVVAPIMGRLSDKHGSRIIATIGLIMMMATVLIYLTMTATSSLYIILVASFVSGIGIAMFFPANSRAVMANADPRYYGAISGLSRLMQNIGILCSYVLTIAIATLAVSRATAFQIFLGTSHLIGGVSQEFLIGFRTSLEASLVILFIAAVLSFLRGKDKAGAGTGHS